MKRKPLINGKKHCASCDSWKKLEHFHKNRNNWTGFHAFCKCCMKESSIARYKRDGERLRKIGREYNRKNPRIRKNAKLISKFGINIVQFDKILKKQKSRCAICKVKKKVLCVDHCHRTKKVRGLLCINCNTGLGLFCDNKIYLKSAIRYLVHI